MALPDLQSIAELEDLVRGEPDLYVRYSKGYESDREGGSLDTESGIKLPGLSVNPLRPEAWWTRPLQDWLARQLCQYKHLMEKNPDRYAWVARGQCIARGPDCEPLLTEVTPIARLSNTLLDEAQRIYEDRFDAGTGPED